MTSWHDDFKARVAFAAGVISRGDRTSRKFDSTCENDDGDAVVAALVRRAQKRPDTAFARNLWRYLCREGAIETAEKLAGADLEAVALAMRREAAKTCLTL